MIMLRLFSIFVKTVYLDNLYSVA